MVIQNVKTGEILTMASEPGYDLSTYLEVTRDLQRRRTIPFEQGG